MAALWLNARCPSASAGSFGKSGDPSGIRTRVRVLERSVEIGSHSSDVAPFDPTPVPHGGLHAAATERNREPILEVLRRVLPARGIVLEIASGTGQHVAFFACALRELRWQPSDASAVHLDSIRAWCDASGADNIAPALLLDVERQPWPVSHADAIMNINMIHIAPWSATRALFDGAARVLAPAGVLFLYGP